MRTKYEILEWIKDTEKEIKHNAYGLNGGYFLDEEEKEYAQHEIIILKNKLETLNIVLDKPNYRRTIYDLTKEEITSLFARIGIINDYEDISEISISKYSDSIKVYFTEYKTGIEGDCIYLENEYIIKENLDIYCLIDSFSCYAVSNQSLFIDTIREMLSMEKPE